MTVAGPGEDALLLVDDDEDLRADTAALLRTDGFHVIEAPSSEAALAIIRHYDGAIEWLMTDVMLGKMSATHVAFEYRFIHPNRPIVFMSAGEPPAEIERISGSMMLPKPFTNAELRAIAASLRNGDHPPAISS